VYAAVFEHSREGVLVLDARQRLVQLNPAAERLFGERGALLGRPLEQVLPEWSSPEELSWRGRSFRVQRVPLPGVEGQPGGQLLLVREERQHEPLDATLRQQLEYFTSLVEHSQLAIATLDLQFRVLSWNPTAEKLFGYSRREALGQRVLDLVANKEAVRSEAEGTARNAMRQGRVHTVTRRVRKDGSLVDVELMAWPVFAEGEHLGYIAMYQDITELQRARQAAEAANQAKSAFLATMSHEIRTPMNGIIGMTALLLDTPLTPAQRDLISTLRHSGDALLSILDDILDFSKIEAGRLELERHPFDPRQCVESVLDLLSARATEKGLDLGCLVAANTPRRVLGDGSRLRQVLLNLVGNAVKFTQRGEVVVSVDAAWRPEDAMGDFEVHFAVRDSGPGVTPAQKERLFQPFGQLDASVTRRYGGTGLGLVICKRLVEAMGGRIWVESEGIPGRGTTFHFTLRVPAAAGAPSFEADAEPPLPGGKRVLIVDGNTTSRKLLELQLHSWGIEPVSVGSGAEALSRLETDARFDLAILDSQLPLLDGPALAGLLRRREEGRELPLVLLSSLGHREDDSRTSGFSAVLTRPVRASQLHDVLVGCLSRGSTPLLVPPRTRTVEPASDFDGTLGARLPLRILLAEDNATNQKLALLVLERLGYSATVAPNGLEVLRALSWQRYDVILMDVQMPELDGLETTRRIRGELPAAEQPRIIAMTANAMESDRRACLAAGMDDYLRKPLMVRELIAALQRGRLPGPLPEEPASVPAPAGAELAPAALERLRRTLGRKAEQLLPGLVDLLLRDVPRLQDEARSALEQGQPEVLRRVAHTLKSNAANFGASALAAMYLDIERRTQTGALEGLAELLSQSEAEYARIRGALERLKGGGPS
jgi:PAS domain S-box-containing protein